ncbi:MAG TPA: endolytic transglycosylase MltG [Candidatus Saccharimonadales bacterium]|nr:endolytic transglycosylase MltG [Candidatus Saccharimonadales bacterium]
MTTYNTRPIRRHRIPRRVWLILLILIILAAGGTVAVQRWYDVQLRPVGSSSAVHYFTVADGSTASQIGESLQAAGLIRSSRAFDWYVSTHNDRDKLQAGTYRFMSSQSTAEIAEAMVQGKIATDLVTILPGQRLDQIRSSFIKAGFNAAAVDAALDVSQYRATYPALADNPPGASLEGFLYPDSFQKTAGTDPKQIIGESLAEMQTHLTSSIRASFAAEGLTVYQGVTIASIVEQEVPGQNDRNQAAQVFLKRLQIDMPLGSDVTAYYGAVKAGVTPTTDYDSPYNTLLHKGLPPGPIGTISDSSLQAVAHPANTDWLYFVTGDDGVTHFAKTLDEHNANVSKYCHKLCSEAQ